MGGLPTEKTVYTVASHHRKPQVIFAALREGIYRSSNRGEDWTILKGSPTSVVALAIHPEQAEVLYAATGEGAVYRSQDGGISWQQQTKAARVMGR
ncbi:MAG: WD40/YVTN/BNR-like repeat-containing protein [Candidatus Methylomirabilales bacterium]